MNKIIAFFLRKEKSFDYVIVGSSVAINASIARCVSDMGFSVCVIIKNEGKLGFEPAFDEPAFLQELSFELGIKMGAIYNTEDYLSYLFRYASNPELITYYGSNYRIQDLGNGTELNSFYVYQSSRKRTTSIDEMIYSLLPTTESLWWRYMVQKAKIKVVSGRKMIVTRWLRFMQGWGGGNVDGMLVFNTRRPNVDVFFAGDQVEINDPTKEQAAEMLKMEVSKIKEFLVNLKAAR